MSFLWFFAVLHIFFESSFFVCAETEPLSTAFYTNTAQPFVNYASTPCATTSMASNSCTPDESQFEAWLSTNNGIRALLQRVDSISKDLTEENLKHFMDMAHQMGNDLAFAQDKLTNIDCLGRNNAARLFTGVTGAIQDFTYALRTLLQNADGISKIPGAHEAIVLLFEQGESALSAYVEALEMLLIKNPMSYHCSGLTEVNSRLQVLNTIMAKMQSALGMEQAPIRTLKVRNCGRPEVTITGWCQITSRSSHTSEHALKSTSTALTDFSQSTSLSVLSNTSPLSSVNPPGTFFPEKTTIVSEKTTSTGTMPHSFRPTSALLSTSEKIPSMSSPTLSSKLSSTQRPTQFPTVVSLTAPNTPSSKGSLRRSTGSSLKIRSSTVMSTSNVKNSSCRESAKGSTFTTSTKQGQSSMRSSILSSERPTVSSISTQGTSSIGPGLSEMITSTASSRKASRGLTGSEALSTTKLSKSSRPDLPSLSAAASSHNCYASSSTYSHFHEDSRSERLGSTSSLRHGSRSSTASISSDLKSSIVTDTSKEEFASSTPMTSVTYPLPSHTSHKVSTSHCKKVSSTRPFGESSRLAIGSGTTITPKPSSVISSSREGYSSEALKTSIYSKATLSQRYTPSGTRSLSRTGRSPTHNSTGSTCSFWRQSDSSSQVSATATNSEASSTLSNAMSSSSCDQAPQTPNGSSVRSLLVSTINATELLPGSMTVTGSTTRGLQSSCFTSPSRVGSDYAQSSLFAENLVSSTRPTVASSRHSSFRNTLLSSRGEAIGSSDTVFTEASERRSAHSSITKSPGTTHQSCQVTLSVSSELLDSAQVSTNPQSWPQRASKVPSPFKHSVESDTGTKTLVRSTETFSSAEVTSNNVLLGNSSASTARRSTSSVEGASSTGQGKAGSGQGGKETAVGSQSVQNGAYKPYFPRSLAYIGFITSIFIL